MTASICAELARSSAAMVGIATLTMKASTPNMNCADTTIASTHQRRDESALAETIWCMAAASSEMSWTGSSHFQVTAAITSGVGIPTGLARLLHGSTHLPCSDRLDVRL